MAVSPSLVGMLSQIRRGQALPKPFYDPAMSNAVSPNFPVRVAMVEDDPGTRERFAKAIASDSRLALVVSFDKGRDCLNWLEHNAPDVLLSDLGLPDVPGLAVIGYCAARHPRTDILVVSMLADEEHVLRSLAAGATGYLLKDAMRDEVCERILELAQGGAPMTPTIARMVLKRLHPPTPAAAPSAKPLRADEFNPLTDRELLVLTRIAQGFSYQEMAELLGLSPHTVHAHTKNIYRKLAVHSRTEAVFEATRLGLIDP
jgi:DNA-binding NarL/FixJ family response regulator